MKYYTNNTEIRAFDDDINPSDWVDLSVYREMTDDEIYQHEHPEEFLTDAEKLAIKRAAMPALTPKQIKLVLALNGHNEAAMQTALETIEDTQTRLVAQYEWNYALSFERMNERTVMLAGLMGLTDEQIDTMWEAAIKL